MNGLEVIGVKVEASASSGAMHANAIPLLHEVRHALAKLLDSGEPTIIDLRGIPMGPGDEERLYAVLGEGEVEARLDALGSSTIRETGVAGVWLVEHRNSEGEPMGKFLEVTFMPSILRSQVEDMQAGLRRLSTHLAAQADR